jgi:Lon protease-like protein
LAERRRFITTFLDTLIQTFYSAEHAERGRQHEEDIREIAGNPNDLPIFVCTLALPFAPVTLHVYEPRYKLMLRRVIENETRCFGMCMYSELTDYHYTEYGCVLDIQDCQFTRDGRAILNSMGGRRFRVVQSSTRDGYNMAHVEWIKDERVETEEAISGELLF